MTEKAINVDMGSIFDVEPTSTLEKALNKVDSNDAAAETIQEAKFQFRDLLTSEQRAALSKNAPKHAEMMLNDYNIILNFGSGVLEKLNSSSTSLLEAQKHIKIPAAEDIVNNLLREVDGFNAKYRNAKVEDTMSRIKRFFKANAYTLKTMIRETKPIVEKIDMAETSMLSMERELADNVTRGRILLDQTLTTLEEVAAVLAAFEEISEIVRKDFDEATKLIDDNTTSGDDVISVEWKGETITLNRMKEIQADLSQGISEIEQTWFAWRQQLFLGYAQAPSIRNISIVSMKMQRKCQQFRTMGLPAARSALAKWQQAALAEEAADMGNAISSGVNDLIQTAFSESAEAVRKVAEAAEAPIISQETILSVTESIKTECESLVKASANGRVVREQILESMSSNERIINQAVTDSRKEIVKGVIDSVKSNNLINEGSNTENLLETFTKK